MRTSTISCMLHNCHSVVYLTQYLISCIIKEYQLNKWELKKMTKFETAILKRIDIFLKLFSNFLVIKTIESNTVKSLTDKQLETITPVATDKLKTINENIKTYS